MKLTVLVDNNTYIDQYYLGEPALSYYIECENQYLKKTKRPNLYPCHCISLKV